MYSNIFGSCVGGNRIHQPAKYKTSNPEIQSIKRPIVLKGANIILEIRYGYKQKFFQIGWGGSSCWIFREAKFIPGNVVVLKSWVVSTQFKNLFTLLKFMFSSP